MTECGRGSREKMKEHDAAYGAEEERTVGTGGVLGAAYVSVRASHIGVSAPSTRR